VTPCNLTTTVLQKPAASIFRVQEALLRKIYLKNSLVWCIFNEDKEILEYFL